MGCTRSLLVAVLVGASATAALAQAPTYGLGRAPTAAELGAWDISIRPDGKELPPGRGTVPEGAAIFLARGCVACHGPTGSEGPAPSLIGGEFTSSTDFLPVKFWPFATSVWDYINRAMPMNQSGILTPNEVYSLTAFVLARNDIIKDDAVLDERTLPKVVMPNRSAFVEPRSDWKPRVPRPFTFAPAK